MEPIGCAVPHPEPARLTFWIVGDARIKVLREERIVIRIKEINIVIIYSFQAVSRLHSSSRKLS